MDENVAKEYHYDHQFIIVYDNKNKFNKKIAKGLFNKVCKDYIACVLSAKQYLNSEASITNENRIVFFSEKLIEENLSTLSPKEIAICDGVILKIQGNVVGFVIDPKYELDTLGKEIKKKWPKFVASLIIGGYIAVPRSIRQAIEENMKNMSMRLLLQILGITTLGTLVVSAIIYFLCLNSENRAKLVLYTNAIENFINHEYLKKFMDGKLF